MQRLASSCWRAAPCWEFCLLEEGTCSSEECIMGKQWTKPCAVRSRCDHQNGQACAWPIKVSSGRWRKWRGNDSENQQWRAQLQKDHSRGTFTLPPPLVTNMNCYLFLMMCIIGSREQVLDSLKCGDTNSYENVTLWIFNAGTCNW